MRPTQLSSSRTSLPVVLYLAAVTVAGSALAQQPAKDEFVPQRGQTGKDVVWVPTE